MSEEDGRRCSFSRRSERKPHAARDARHERRRERAGQLEATLIPLIAYALIRGQRATKSPDEKKPPRITTRAPGPGRLDVLDYYYLIVLGPERSKYISDATRWRPRTFRNNTQSRFAAYDARAPARCKADRAAAVTTHLPWDRSNDEWSAMYARSYARRAARPGAFAYGGWTYAWTRGPDDRETRYGHGFCANVWGLIMV